MTRGLAASKPGCGGAGNLPETFHLVPQSIRTVSRVSQVSLRPVLNISLAFQPLRSELRKGAKSAVPLADRANWQPPTVAHWHLPRCEQGPTSGYTSMNSSFGTIVARRRLPHFRHSLVSEPAANQPSTSRSEETEISTHNRLGVAEATR